MSTTLRLVNSSVTVGTSVSKLRLYPGWLGKQEVAKAK